MLNTLRERNADFRTVSNYAINSIAKRTRALTVRSQTSIKRVENYQNIQKAARQVYEALGRACTKHAEHLTLFCVEAENASQDEGSEPKVRFNIAFTQPCADPHSTQTKPLWFMVDSVIGEVAAGGKLGNLVDLNGLTEGLQSQFEPRLGTTNTTGRNSAKAASSLAQSTLSPSSPLPMITGSFVLNEGSERNLCDHLQRCLGQTPPEDVCLGILENVNSCKNHVYPPPSAIRSRWPYATSLGNIVSSTALQQSMSRIPLLERLRLARTLAIAVLQYHATPWLRMSWRKEDVHFLGLDMNPKKYNILSLSTPCLNVKIKGPNETVSRASTFPLDNPVRNPLTFSLGVLLLEIAYSASLESLQRNNDNPARPNDSSYLEFYLARRLSKSGCTGMGTVYDKIVEKLVECDFGCGTDLTNVDLQAAIHDHVICPLEEMERGMAALMSGL